MVLSLFDICRLEIRNGIEKGSTMPVHLLPPILRQSILNTILMHRTINEPNSLALLTSKEFFKDLTLLNTQLGHVDDHKYLDRVATTLAMASENGKTIGSNISELHLSLYDIYYDWITLLLLLFC